MQNPCPYSVLVPIALHRCDKGGKQRITQGQVGVLAETEVYRDTHTPHPAPDWEEKNAWEAMETWAHSRAGL